MKIHIEEITGAIRGFEDDSDYGDDFVLSMSYTRSYEDDDGVVLSRALGDLDNDTNIQIGLSLINAGYKRLYFKTKKGKKVTRYAELVNSDDKWNYWRVDLIKTAQELGRG
jgi:hypothetical protein